MSKRTTEHRAGNRAEDGVRPVNGLQMFCFRTTLARKTPHIKCR